MNFESLGLISSSVKMKSSYSRDFLLSICNLEVCKSLPDGFDKSFISELVEAPQERFRTAGGLPIHNSRRNEYSSSPPTKGDISGHSRPACGRWDSRSSNAYSDIESESSKQNGNQPRRPWQVKEQDGLLGSGSSPRPIAGSSSKVRSLDSYQTNKSAESFTPPKPYKAAPFSPRGSNDSFNDETFSFSENTSEDKVEQERRRRAAFESMRKEQHKDKPAQEKQIKDSFTLLFSEEIESSKQTLSKSNVSSAAVSSARPAVPPGFSTSKPQIPPLNVEGALEVGKQVNNSFPLKDGFLDTSPMIGADDKTTSRFAQWFMEEANQNQDFKVSSVLTCEDVEQSIMLENNLVTSPQISATCFPVDTDASQHLLSLLHKDQPSAPKPLTLETLFGSAFMNELKSDSQNMRQ